MSWHKLNLPQGAKLFKVHNFNFIFNGSNYKLEVDEYSNGSCTGHGEHATDSNYVIESVSGSSVEECIKALIERIESRSE